MMSLVRELYPICRSITGDGVRATLAQIGERLPLETTEVPSGTAAFDWEIPREWTIREAWIKDPSGRTVVDFRDSNLHVLNYSAPVDRKVGLEELRAHVHTLPDHPDWTPYRTSYYAERWGFCMPHRVLDGLEDGEYHVFVDSSLEPGSLTYGEVVLPGEIEDEVLVSTHVCHPSMCNDNLSGIAVVTELAKLLADRPRRYTYRFLFIPGTIGSIAWLSRNQDVVPRIRHGLVVAGVGDPGDPHYKKSQRGDAVIDRIVAHVLRTEAQGHGIRDFVPYGYDERQFCSPAFDLPIGCFSRTPYGEYPEYHSSADGLDFVTADALQDSLRLLVEAVEALEANQTYRNANPHCEPQLGKRGLYDMVGGRQAGEDDRMAILWMLNQSNGTRSLLDVAERSGLPFATLRWATDALVAANLLEEVA